MIFPLRDVVRSGMESRHYIRIDIESACRHLGIVKREAKTSHLQLRLAPAQKRSIQQSARRAGLSVSAWVLSRVLPDSRLRLQQIVEALERDERRSYVLAELNDLLSAMARAELERAVAEPLRLPAFPELQNQVAAMIEVASHRCGVKVPPWVREVPPLTKPVFASSLIGLRLHLLVNAPPPFRRRNLFVDASIGDRV